DIGAGVSGMAAGLDGEHVTGVHVGTDPLTAANTAPFLPGMADRLHENKPAHQPVLDRVDACREGGSGYLAMQHRRPEANGFGPAHPPRLQLAWMAEKAHEGPDLPVDRDQLLTTVSLYWFTRSGATAAHTLYEQAHSSDWGAPPAVPQGFAVFGADQTVRKLVPAPVDAHWTEFDRGRHFPAMEAPAQLAADLRAFFGPLQCPVSGARSGPAAGGSLVAGQVAAAGDRRVGGQEDRPAEPGRPAGPQDERRKNGRHGHSRQLDGPEGEGE